MKVVFYERINSFMLSLQIFLKIVIGAYINNKTAYKKGMYLPLAYLKLSFLVRSHFSSMCANILLVFSSSDIIFCVQKAQHSLNDKYKHKFFTGQQ